MISTIFFFTITNGNDVLQLRGIKSTTSPQDSSTCTVG